MGEANRTAEAKEARAKLTHEILMEWVPRAVLIAVVAVGQGKGLQHARLVSRTLDRLMGDQKEEFEYLMSSLREKGASWSVALTPPGVRKLFVTAVDSSIVKEMVEQGIIGKPTDIASVVVTTREECDCSPRVVKLSTEMLEFVLKLGEDANVPNTVAAAMVDVLEDLEDSKAGRYELPPEVQPEPAPQAEASAAS